MLDFRKEPSPPITRKITFPKLYVSTDYTQKPPKKEEAYFQIFLKFSGDRFVCQEYDFGRPGGPGIILFLGDGYKYVTLKIGPIPRLSCFLGVYGG